VKTRKKSPPGQSKKILHLALSPETHKALRVLAAHHDLSMTGFIEMIALREIRKLKKEYMREYSVDGTADQDVGEKK